MKRRRGRTGPDDPGLPAQGGPTVVSIFEAAEEPRGVILAQLQRMALSLQAVEERAVYDGFCREWTPAYYAGDRQLFHVHNFPTGLRATMFVGVRTLEPSILEADQVAPELRVLVATTSGPRGTKMVKVPLHSPADADAFMELVRVKWGLEQRRLSG